MPEIFTLKSNLSWLDSIPQSIETIFLGKLLHYGVFNEIQDTYRRRFSKRKLIKVEPVGVWGWNSWCGIHTFPLLTGPSIYQILTATYDVGFQRTEPSTGLLPHAIIHDKGVFGSKRTFKCYDGIHGEGYNLDNILCWTKMAMEYFLISNDTQWFTPEILRKITHTIDYILENFRGKFNPALIYSEIEGDWTECTSWTLDNANVNANMLNVLQLVQESQKLLGSLETDNDYSTIYSEILANFNKPITEGGFWDPIHGFYIHGNNGKGTNVQGDKYFEATVNYFAILWGIAPNEYAQRIWAYINQHHQPIEIPYPVLTNYLPRTGARRNNYGKTVTNGDIWMVLGAHAAAARLQAGFLKEGTEMFKKIVDYEREHGVLHNNINQDGSFNDGWDPEIANYGSFYASFVCGVLGMHPTARGLEFHIAGLEGLSEISTTLYFDQQSFMLQLTWVDGKWDSGTIEKRDSDGNFQLQLSISSPQFLLGRGDPWYLEAI